MHDKVLLKGNEAIAEAAIRANCRYYFGYPITPQNEISTYFARYLPKCNGVFLQAESELASINMVYGAAGAGARVMTSSSGPGISLMTEGISYLAGADLPCVVVNISRAGPGLGGVMPSQSDYFLATKACGHGGHKIIVLAPSTVQQMADFTVLAFNLTDKYRVPVMILADGILGQMMEPLILPPIQTDTIEKEWVTTGTKEERKKNIITSMNTGPGQLELKTKKRKEIYDQITKYEQREELYCVDDADVILVAYGTSARVAKESINQVRKNGIKAGLIQPYTLWPFPINAFRKVKKNIKFFLTVEMSDGQLIEDVKLNAGNIPVHLVGKYGGSIPSVEEVTDEIIQHCKEVK